MPHLTRTILPMTARVVRAEAGPAGRVDGNSGCCWSLSPGGLDEGGGMREVGSDGCAAVMLDGGQVVAMFIGEGAGWVVGSDVGE